jgi:hypothetical protein
MEMSRMGMEDWNSGFSSEVEEGTLPCFRD